MIIYEDYKGRWGGEGGRRLITAAIYKGGWAGGGSLGHWKENIVLVILNEGGIHFL